LKESLWTANGPKPFLSDHYRPLISPFISGFELMARFQADDDMDGFDLLSRLWSRMSSPGEDATSTVWEAITLDGKPGLGMNTSLAHGWAAMPAVALSSQVLGIQPITAGYQTWLIRPHPGGLDWAEGSAPTPAGEISVHWDHARGTSQFNLHVSAPKGTIGEIAVPTFGKNVQVIVNGTVAWNGSAAKGFNVHNDGKYLIITQLHDGAYDISTHSAH
jgi:alpha-L-rhamnosidase